MREEKLWSSNTNHDLQLSEVPVIKLGAQAGTAAVPDGQTLQFAGDEGLTLFKLHICLLRRKSPRLFIETIRSQFCMGLGGRRLNSESIGCVSSTGALQSSGTVARRHCCFSWAFSKNQKLFS